MAAYISAPRHWFLQGVLFPSLSSRTFPVSFRTNASGGNLSVLMSVWPGPGCSHGLGTALWFSASWDQWCWRQWWLLVLVAVLAVVTVVMLLVGLLVRTTKPCRPACC